jgi:hypothetical protein
LELLVRISLAKLLLEQPSQGVLQMPLALVQLDRGPAAFDRLGHPAVGIADHPSRCAVKGAEKGAPVGGMGGRERLRVPDARLASSVADGAEDVESDRPSRDPAPLRVLGPDPKRDVVQEQRRLSRPGGRSVTLEDDRCEQLDPVGDELAVRDSRISPVSRS